MHHFTFKKMVKENPQQLFDLIQKYVIEPNTPQEVRVQPIEQSHLTNKAMKQFIISEDEMEHILNIARQAQDWDLTEKLKVKKSVYLCENN